MFLGIIGGLLSTGLQVYGSLQQGKVAQQTARYNNMLAQREADNLESETAENIKRQRINNRRAMATLRLRAANSGTLSTSGTTARVMEDAAGSMQVGIADAARAAAIQAESIRARGRMQLWEGRLAKQASTLQAVGYGIAGLTQAASNTYASRQAGSI